MRRALIPVRPFHFRGAVTGEDGRAPDKTQPLRVQHKPLWAVVVGSLSNRQSPLFRFVCRTTCASLGRSVTNSLLNVQAWQGSIASEHPAPAHVRTIGRIIQD